MACVTTERVQVLPEDSSLPHVLTTVPRTAAHFYRTPSPQQDLSFFFIFTCTGIFRSVTLCAARLFHSPQTFTIFSPLHEELCSGARCCVVRKWHVASVGSRRVLARSFTFSHCTADLERHLSSPERTSQFRGPRKTSGVPIVYTCSSKAQGTDELLLFFEGYVVILGDVNYMMLS